MKVKRVKVLALGYGRGTVWAREGKLGVSFLHIYTEEGVQREVVLRAETPEEAVEEALGRDYQGLRRPRAASRVVVDSGYVSALNGSRWNPEHRVVMAAMIRRELLPGEHVHHVNHIRTDNRPGNLWLFPNSASHAAWHKLERTGGLLSKPMPAVPLA